jgi:hypothetical protein
MVDHAIVPRSPMIRASAVPAPLARSSRKCASLQVAAGFKPPRGLCGRAPSQNGSGRRCDNRCRLNMASSSPARVLIVAHRTAATPLLLNAVRARASRSCCSFTLLVPRPYWDPDTDEAAATLELAIPVLEEAAGGHVDGIIGDTDPLVAVREAVTSIGIDEIIISTLPVRVSHWLRRDLPQRVEQFGLPVTIVTAQQSERAIADRH